MRRYSHVVRWELASNPFIDVFRDILCQQSLDVLGAECQAKIVAPSDNGTMETAHTIDAKEIAQIKRELVRTYPWLREYASADVDHAPAADPEKEVEEEEEEGGHAPSTRRSSSGRNSPHSGATPANSLSSQPVYVSYEFITPPNGPAASGAF